MTNPGPTALEAPVPPEALAGPDATMPAPAARPAAAPSPPLAPHARERGTGPALVPLVGTDTMLLAGQILPLDEPGVMWLVRRGVIEIFACQYHDGAAVRPRLFLCAVADGGVVFGLPSSEAENEVRVLAVATTDSVLARHDLSSRAGAPLTAFQTRTLTGVIDAWIAGLSETLALDIRPRSVPKLWIRPGDAIDLKPGERASGQRGVVWAHLVDGSGRFVDVVDLDGGERSGGTPALVALTPQTWLRENGVRTLHGHATDAVLRMRGWPAILDDFHAAAVKALQYGFRNSTAIEGAWLERRASQVAADTERTLFKFASLLDEHSPYRPGITAENALYECCALVGKALGLTLDPPPSARRKRADDPPLTIEDIASYGQVRARQVALRGGWWAMDSGPLVGFLKDDDRPVALLWSRKAYEMHEPVSDTVVRITGAQAERLSPVAYAFYPPLPERKLGVSDILAFGLSRCRTDITMVLLTGAAGGLLASLVPIATGYVFDTVIPGHQRHQILQVGAALMVVAFATAIFKLTGDIALLRMEGKIAGILQAAVVDRLLRLPNTFFAQYSAGDLATRTLVIEQIRRSLTSVVLGSMLAGVFSLFSFAVLFYFNGWAAIVATIVLVFLMVVTLYAGWAQLNAIMQGEALSGNINSMVLDIITGITKLRLAGAEVRAYNQWGADFSEMRRRMVKARMMTNLFGVFTSGYEIVSLAAVFAVIAIMSGQALSTGMFLAFVGAFATFLAAVLQLSRAVIQVFSIAPLYKRAVPILQALPENMGVKADPGVLTGGFEVSQVHFRYQRDLPRVLNGLSLSAKPGEFVAVVGASGSGKSTLIKLMLGFERPEAGAILFDGRDLRGLDLHLVRRQIGVVMQSGRLMPGTIFENIKGASHTTIDDAWEAARMAGLDRDIKAMPMGMHTVLTEGAAALSGGQIQRILLARAIVAKPRLLLLDEATSALDNRTQAVVTESLDRLSVTRLVIAHRLTTIMKADRIFVLRDGRVAEEGPYEALMAKNGVFADLVRRQQI